MASPPEDNMQHLIEKKSKGQELSEEDIKRFVDGIANYTEDSLGKMLKAFAQNLTEVEAVKLTKYMTESGDVLQWPETWKDPSSRFWVVDKHSTGGVGDKTSLVLAPALAACGLKVPMISGRSLEHTGGTLDKMESIPGFNVEQPIEKIKEAVEKVGCCIVAQTKEIAPADKRMYAMREKTGTVNNDGLIVSSIMSKKLAETLDALVLDVKVGKSAFLKTKERASTVAKLMVKVGKDNGVKTVAVLTSMDVPIGHMVGNALEVVEALLCLHGNGPEGVLKLVTILGGELITRCDGQIGKEEAKGKIQTVLEDGTALAKFREMLKLQGVSEMDADDLCKANTKDDMFKILKIDNHPEEIKSPQSGYVNEIDAMACAEVCRDLGATRTPQRDKIDPSVGIELCTSVGKPISKGAISILERWGVASKPPPLQ